MVYSTRRFVVCLTVCHFVLVFFSPFSIAITSLGEERANLSAFSTFVRFMLVWICRFHLPLGVWEGLRFVIVALPGLFSYLFGGFLSTDCRRERVNLTEASKFMKNINLIVLKGQFLQLQHMRVLQKSFVTGFGLVQCYVWSNIFLLQKR